MDDSEVRGAVPMGQAPRIERGTVIVSKIARDDDVVTDC